MKNYTDEEYKEYEELTRIANIKRYAETRKVLELNQNRDYVLEHLEGVPDWWLEAGKRWNFLYDFKSWLFKVDSSIIQTEPTNWIEAVMDYQQALFSHFNFGATGSDKYSEPKTCKEVERILLTEIKKLNISKLPKIDWVLPKYYNQFIEYRLGNPAVIKIAENELVEFVSTI